MNYTDTAVAQMVKKFCGQVVWLRIVRNIYKELFEEEKDHILMERTAPSFFSYLNIILHNYLLLEFVKITDPATSKTSKGEARENFTVDNLIKCIEWPKDVHQKLKSLNEKTKTFRRYTPKMQGINCLLIWINKYFYPMKSWENSQKKRMKDS